MHERNCLRCSCHPPKLYAGKSDGLQCFLLCRRGERNGGSLSLCCLLRAWEVEYFWNHLGPLNADSSHCFGGSQYYSHHCVLRLYLSSNQLHWSYQLEI